MANSSQFQHNLNLGSRAGGLIWQDGLKIVQRDPQYNYRDLEEYFDI